MELRPPAKIAIGVVGALGTIAALHFTIFASRADAYARAKSEYDTALAGYRSAGRTPSPATINAFRYGTIKQRLAYWEAKKDLNFFLPEFYASGDFKRILEEHRAVSWSTVRRLVELRREGEAGNGPRLSFLTGNRAWNLVESLPQELVQRGVVVEDALNDLRDEDRLLNSLAPGSRQFLERTNTYNRKLGALGLDVNFRNGVRDFLGQQVATFYTLNRIDQVLRNLPPDHFGPNATEADKMEQLYRLFRIEWPKDHNNNESPLIAQRQAEALLALIELAKEKGVQEIPYVRLVNFRELKWQAFDPNAAAAATPPPAAAFSEFDFMDEFDFDGRGMGGGGSRFGGGGSRFGGGGGAAAAPVDDASVVGLIAPIEIFIRGNNQSIIEFMHSVTNSRNPMEIDRVRLRNIRPQDGLMEAQLFINVIAYANYVGATNAQDVERIIVETRRSLAEISMSVGARDLAEADGLVVVRDGRYELATPSPTPHPATQAAQPVVVVDEFDDFR